MWPNPLETPDFVAFTEEILNGKLHFLCSGISEWLFLKLRTFILTQLNKRYIIWWNFDTKIEYKPLCLFPFAIGGNIQVDGRELTEFSHWCSTQSVSFCSFFFVKSILSGVTCTEADYYVSLVNRIKVFLIWYIKYITRYSWFSSCNVTSLHLVYRYHIILRQFNANRE